MAKFTAESFTENILSITVGGIIFGAVAWPIFADIIDDQGLDPTVAAVIKAIPIFLGVGLLVACVKLFISNKN